MKRLFLALLIPAFLFGLDLATLKQKSDEKNENFLNSIIKASPIYEDESEIPNDLKVGDTFIIENEYGAKSFYILSPNGDMDAFVHAFFNEILNKESGSTFSHIFTSSGTGEHKTGTNTSSKKDNPFKAYVSETDAVRVDSVNVPARADHMEKALNDFLLDNNIEPASIINIHPMMDSKSEMKLIIFYRP